MPLIKLPFGSEFSPSQIDLPKLLEIVHANQGDRDQLLAGILQEFFSEHAKKTTDAAKQAKNRRTLALNCRIGLSKYGIIDEDANFTDFGKKLYGLRGVPAHLYDEMARHILTSLHGMRLISAIQSMAAAGEDLTLENS